MRWSFVILLFVCYSSITSGQSVTGPCTLNRNGLACTRNGYFEMVQCTSYDCFCVSAQTGEVAEETRTGAPRKLPTCAKCHLTLREIFSSSLSLSPTAFIPVCDKKKGSYKEVQCHPSRRECWCVETTSGEEIRGTRQSMANNAILACAPQTGARNGKGPFATNYKKVEYPVARETCRLPIDRGYRCNQKKPTIAYYFDIDHADCFAFEFLGCGGNDNRHVNKRECQSQCNLADMGGCAGLAEPNGTCNPNEQIWVPPPPPGVAAPSTQPPKPLCPTGFNCRMGAFFGFCCPADIEDLYNREYNPSCPNGLRAHSDFTGDWDEIRLGRRCSDNFCPSGKRCMQGQLFAFCC